MSNTIDELMLRSVTKERQDKTEREKELEGQVQRRGEELEALATTLKQIISQSSSAKENAQAILSHHKDDPPAMAADAGTEVRSLASALNQAMTAAASPSFQSPQKRSPVSWADVGPAAQSSAPAGAHQTTAMPSFFAAAPPPVGDPFAEIRLATQKLQEAQNALRPPGAAKFGAAQFGAAATAATFAAKTKAKAKPKMYYV